MLQLRKFEEADFDRLISWIPNARFLWQWAGPTFTFPLDKAQLHEYMEGTAWQPPHKYIFTAVLVPENCAIGHVEIANINYQKQTAVLCRVLIGAPQMRGKSYGTEMVRQALAFAFQEIGLRLLILGVYDFNHGAIRCYEKLGFKRAVLREKARRFEDEYWNLLVMRLKRADWLQQNL